MIGYVPRFGFSAGIRGEDFAESGELLVGASKRRGGPGIEGSTGAGNSCLLLAGGCSALPPKLPAIGGRRQPGLLTENDRELTGVGEARAARDLGHGNRGAGQQSLAAFEV